MRQAQFHTKVKAMTDIDNFQLKNYFGGITALAVMKDNQLIICYNYIYIHIR